MKDILAINCPALTDIVLLTWKNCFHLMQTYVVGKITKLINQWALMTTIGLDTSEGVLVGNVDSLKN